MKKNVRKVCLRGWENREFHELSESKNCGGGYYYCYICKRAVFSIEVIKDGQIYKEYRQADEVNNKDDQGGSDDSLCVCL